MNETPQVTIFLSTPEAELFKSFNQFHATFALLCKAGVFDIKSGWVKIHFDEHGGVGLIERNDTLYNARVK